MRGFSLLGRTLPPDALAELLTEFREVVTPVVFELGGAVDKFIGDGALIVSARWSRGRTTRRGPFNAVIASSMPSRAGASIARSEEHTSELQSLMRHSYVVLRLKKK